MTTANSSLTDRVAKKPGTTMPNNIKRFDDAERREVLCMMKALGLFQQYRRDMPLQYVVTLLAVALNEGQTVMEYARTQGISPSVMSRHLLDIGERNRHMEEGFGLVTWKPNPMNLREHLYELTPKGRVLVHQVIRAIRSH